MSVSTTDCKHELLLGESALIRGQAQFFSACSAPNTFTRFRLVQKTFNSAYLDYLRSEHWRQLKDALFRCRPRRCETCGHTGAVWPIDAHHLVYRTPLERGTIGDLLVLCRRCHDIAHDLNIAALFIHGAPPIEIVRQRTVAEIIRYLPELEPIDKQPLRIRLNQAPRVAVVARKFWSRRAAKTHAKILNQRTRVLSENALLAERQRHLRPLVSREIWLD